MANKTEDKMANKTEAIAKAEQGTALAQAPSDNDALAALDAAGVNDADGLGEFSPSDFRTPVKLFNVSGGDTADGRKLTKDMFYDTVTKVASSELRLALLHVHKTNVYSFYDKKEERTQRVCSSFDQVVGTMEDGTVRPCKGCPDAVWRTVDGKREVNCSEVWNAAAYDFDAQAVVMLRFKRTSLDPIRRYLQQHFLGKRPAANGQRRNLPVFTYLTTARLEMHKSGNYALPVLERGPVFASADLKVLAETAEGVRMTLLQRLADADENQAAAEGDISFNTDELSAPLGADGAERGAVGFVE